ncbi:Ankyrin repeat, bromo and BTB domain-containing protein [Stylophora pistillata]|uniref:Ankyrin repeat, bromo and BTB domain-containing protein n=1 Tax=Stylophora pistillata TaxID=50429 RepID=A0A2B4SVN0_STYPI|nr:Ankyrin repeat, bromo and BTB domain-containing protein [Stylophora pistillata]
MDRTPKKESSMSAVERILDSLRLSPKWSRQSAVNGKSVKETRIIVNRDSGLTNQHLSSYNRKHATISTSSSDYPETEKNDSFSDSAYSQSSETSINSGDRRSLNTTSTDSDNNRLFYKDTSPRSRICSRGDAAELSSETGSKKKKKKVTEKAYAEAKSILEEQDLDLNSQTPNGQTLLHIASANADLKCAQLLIQHGSDVNLKDASGWTPLHAAVRRGNWKCAILLIEAGADFGEYAQTRIQEYNQVLQMSSSYYRSVEIFV